MIERVILTDELIEVPDIIETIKFACDETIDFQEGNLEVHLFKHSKSPIPYKILVFPFLQWNSHTHMNPNIVGGNIFFCAGKIRMKVNYCRSKITMLYYKNGVQSIGIVSNDPKFIEKK